MSKVSSVMNIAQRSMMNSQTGLQTVSHNIANKNTEGYSRQRLDIQSTPPTGLGRVQIGTGAKTQAVTRINNPHLEKQIQMESSKLGFGEGKVSYLDRVEQVFNEQVNKGLNHYMSEFFNSYRELSNYPESLPIRTQVKETALHLTQDFHRVNTQLKTIQEEIDGEIKVQLEEINRITEEIADLNQKIEAVEITGSKANDHRDRRDLLIKNLGEKINIKHAEVDKGKVNVTLGNTVTLVSGYDSMKLSAASTPEQGNKRVGNVDIMFQMSRDGQPFRVTDQVKGGKLGGMLEVRDEVINSFLNKVDDLAFTFAKAVNDAHASGFDQKGQPAGKLFTGNGTVRDFSQYIGLEPRVEKDVGLIAAAIAPDAPADNRLANVIASIQYKGIMNGTDTLDDFYNGMVGELSVLSRKTRSLHEHQADSLNQLKNIRESISGVSLDEETVKMIEYQKAFDASARLIRTADEMLDTVLNLKR